jgi:outer membrane protein TolC
MSSIENLEAKFALNEQEAQALEDATKIANELYLAGYANYLEVVTAQGNAIAAERKAVKTKKELLFSTVNLYRALGGGWE